MWVTSAHTLVPYQDISANSPENPGTLRVGMILGHQQYIVVRYLYMLLRTEDIIILVPYQEFFFTFWYGTWIGILEH